MFSNSYIVLFIPILGADTPSQSGFGSMTTKK